MSKSDRLEISKQFVTAIRALRCILIYMGIWPVRKYEKLYNLLWYYHSINLVFVNFGLMCNAIRVRHDVNKIIYTLSVASGVMYILAKWLVFAWHKALVKKLAHFMNEDWTNLENNSIIPQSVPDSKRIMLKYCRALNIYIYSIVVLMSGGLGNFVISFAVATNHRDNNTDIDNILPVANSWYPGVDYNRDYIIQLLSVAQIMSMTSSFAGTTAIDSFLVMSILHTTGQFEILGLFIERMKYKSSDPEFDKANVKEIAKRHQVLLSVTEDIKKCFSTITFLRVSVSLVCICFTAHVFVGELQKGGQGYMIALKYGFICFAALANVFVYCLVSDTLTTQALAITTNVYNSEWYKTTSSVNLALSIVMIAASRPIIISAAKIFPLTMENFTVIIKSLASYLSALRAVSISNVQ